jgi:hypothetical protein
MESEEEKNKKLKRRINYILNKPIIRLRQADYYQKNKEKIKNKKIKKNLIIIMENESLFPESLTQVYIDEGSVVINEINSMTVN